MEYEDFELQIGPRTEEGYLLHVLRSPAGEGEGLLQLPREMGELERIGSPLAAGEELFQALFQEQIGELFHQSLHRTDSGKAGWGLRVRLRIHPREAALHQLPWELLYRRATQEFLTLSRRTPVVRTLDVPRSSELPPFTAPLRVLVVLSQDPQGSMLGLEEELEELKKSLNLNPAIQHEVLRNPEPRKLRAELMRHPYHVLHYMGHGRFESGRGEGILHFGGPGGHRVEVAGRYLATLLNDAESLRLVVLNACESARSACIPGHNPFAGAATALVLGGLPAVVAMQSRIGDSYAIAFSSAFYDQLVHQRSVEEAITEGRQAIFSFHPPQGDWAIPVLFLRTPTGDLFRKEPNYIEVKLPSSLPWRASKWTVPVMVALSIPLFFTCRLALLEQWRSADAEIAFDTAPIPNRPHLPLSRQTPPRPIPAGLTLGGRTESRHPGIHRSEGPEPRPGSSQVSRFVTVGSGDHAFNFSISAGSEFVDAFTQSLSRSARSLGSFGLSGAAVSIIVSSPSVAESTAGGFSDTNCSLQASGRVSGKHFSIGPIKRAADDRFTACRLAAEDLAALVPDEVSALL